MTIIEKNVREWNEELGLIDKYKKEEKMSIAKKMLTSGCSIEYIIKMTELSREEIVNLQK